MIRFGAILYVYGDIGGENNGRMRKSRITGIDG
jgi:hypothetical protein